MATNGVGYRCTFFTHGTNCWVVRPGDGSPSVVVVVVVLLLLLLLLGNPKVLSLHNRSLPNFACTQVTPLFLSTMAP